MCFSLRYEGWKTAHRYNIAGFMDDNCFQVVSHSNVAVVVAVECGMCAHLVEDTQLLQSN